MKFTLHIPDEIVSFLSDVYQQHCHASGDLPVMEVRLEQAIQVISSSFMATEGADAEAPMADPSAFMSVATPVNAEELERFLSQSLDPIPDLDPVSLEDFDEPPTSPDGKVPWPYITARYSHLPIIERLASEPDMHDKIEAVRTALTGLPEDLWEAESTQQVLHRVIARPGG